MAPIKPVLAAAAAAVPFLVMEVGLEDGISLDDNDGTLKGLKGGLSENKASNPSVFAWCILVLPR